MARKRHSSKGVAAKLRQVEFCLARARAWRILRVSLILDCALGAKDARSISVRVLWPSARNRYCGNHANEYDKPAENPGNYGKICLVRRRVSYGIATKV